MAKEKSKTITTDSETLKELIATQTKSWFHRSIGGLILCNLGLLITIGWGLVSDHFTVKSLAATAEIHTKLISITTDKVNNLETKTYVIEEKIKHINGN